MGDVVPVGDGDRLAAPDVPGLECLECREPCERRSARLGGRICGGFWGEGVQRLVTHEARKALIRQTRYRRPLSQRAMYFVFMASR